MPYTAQAALPYDPASRDLSVETPSLGEVVQEAVSQGALRLRVMLPAKITAVSGDQEVDVQPMLQVRYVSAADPVDLPIVKSVPVLMFQGSKFLMRLPLSVDDAGMLVFCDRSLDAWSASTGDSPVDPQDVRAHHLSDAVFIPGLVPSAKQTAVGTDDLLLKAGQAQVTLKQNGKLAIGSNASGGQELLSLLDQTLQALLDTLGNLTTATVMTMIGPQPFLASTIAALQQNQATVQQIKANLGSIKT